MTPFVCLVSISQALAVSCDARSGPLALWEKFGVPVHTSTFQSEPLLTRPIAKAKPEYVKRTSGGGKWTIIMGLISAFLVWGELARWWRGAEHHFFAVEKGISQNMQINMDVVVKMKCGDVHVNVQDASGDLILAGMLLKREDTLWSHWADKKGVHKLGRDAEGRVVTGAGYHGEEAFGEDHVHDIVALGKKKAKWAKTPKVKGTADSCRLYGSMDLNKVQGDFHITARGHGYRGVGEHLDHDSTLLTPLPPCLSRATC